VSHLVLIVTALVVGAVLAVGATFATSAVISSPPAHSNQAAFNYGS
jgi:hypothetical protein